MNYKLKTSKKTQELLIEMRDGLRISPNILSRYAIALYLVSKKEIPIEPDDNNGLEFNRNVLLGSMDSVFKVAIETYIGRHLDDEEYFPTFIKLVLDSGVQELYYEYKFANSNQQFIQNLIDLGEGVILA